MHRSGDDPRASTLRLPDETGPVHENQGSFDAVTANAIVSHRTAGNAPPPGVAHVQQDQIPRSLPSAAVVQQPQPELKPVPKSKAAPACTYAAGKWPRKRGVAAEPEEFRKLEAIRKEKNRIKQRRHYHKKKDLVKKVMPAEMAERESNFEQRIVAFLGDNKSSAHTKHELLMADDSELSIAGKTREEQAQTLCRIKLLQATLLEQNERSATLLRDFKAFSRGIQDELDELHSESVESKAQSNQELSMYALILSKSLDDIRLLKTNENFTTFRGCIHGWQETRIVKGDLFSWSMQKTVSTYTPDVLAQRTWEICTDPVRWAKLFSSVTMMQGRRVNQVSANQVLMFQQYLGMKPVGDGRQQHHQLRVKTLSLVSRVTTSKGVLMTVIRGLPSDQIFADGRGVSANGKNAVNEVWNDLFCWMEAERTADSAQGTICRFAGFCPTLRDRAIEHFWMHEVVTLARNWEHMALGDHRGGKSTP